MAIAGDNDEEDREQAAIVQKILRAVNYRARFCSQLKRQSQKRLKTYQSLDHNQQCISLGQIQVSIIFISLKAGDRPGRRRGGDKIGVQGALKEGSPGQKQSRGFHGGFQEALCGLQKSLGEGRC